LTCASVCRAAASVLSHRALAASVQAVRLSIRVAMPRRSLPLRQRHERRLLLLRPALPVVHVITRSFSRLAETSPLADKYSCGKRVKLPEVVDAKAGYVWDSTRQDPGTDGWGHYPKSGRSEVYQFPNCKDGRVVADVVKLRKGHTEGYEPNVTDKIIELAVSAKGGKIAKGSWNPPVPVPAANPFGR